MLGQDHYSLACLGVTRGERPTQETLLSLKMKINVKITSSEHILYTGLKNSPFLLYFVKLTKFTK